MGVDGLLEHLQAVFEVDGPERLTPFGESVAAPDVVDENVQAFVLAFYTGGEPLNLGRTFVIHFYGDTVPSGGRDQFGGLFNGFAQTGCGQELLGTFSRTFSRTTAGAVDCGPGLAESDGNAAASAACGSGHQSDLALQYFVRELLWCASHPHSPAAHDSKYARVPCLELERGWA